ncbi:MAG: hypothetical protein HDR92_00640 [Bacteroides sp.]|nr:hypothetical protein [Bacteroides sp.]
MIKRTSMQLLPFVAAMSLTLLCGCRTTESNYKNAYETVVAHQREKNDSDVPGMTQSGTPLPKETEIAPGVTVPLLTAWISSAKENDVADRDTVKRYNVAVGRFRQAFNARQMLSRLRSSGYPEALVLKSTDCYFVATSTTAIPDSAINRLRRVEADSSLRLRAPYPFILRPGHLAR